MEAAPGAELASPVSVPGPRVQGVGCMLPGSEASLKASDMGLGPERKGPASRRSSSGRGLLSSLCADSKNRGFRSLGIWTAREPCQAAMCAHLL